MLGEVKILLIRKFSFLIGCLQLAEQSVELRKEKETLGLLRQKRMDLEEKLLIKKLLRSSLIQNMTGVSEVLITATIT